MTSSGNLLCCCLFFPVVSSDSDSDSDLSSSSLEDRLLATGARAPKGDKPQRESGKHSQYTAPFQGPGCKWLRCFLGLWLPSRCLWSCSRSGRRSGPGAGMLQAEALAPLQSRRKKSPRCMCRGGARRADLANLPAHPEFLPKLTASFPKMRLCLVSDDGCKNQVRSSLGSALP